MISLLYSIAGFLIAITILVAVHEFGHYWVAKKLGVKVLRFSIGFGKPLWRKIAGSDQTEYVIAALPLGGYVKMLDEAEGEVATHELPRAFNRQPIWKRTLIVVAGPAINFLFAILLFFVLGLMPSEALKPVLGDIPQTSAASQAGIKSGDQLLSIDGKSYDFFGQHDLYVFNQVLKGKDIHLQTRRGTEQGSYTLPVKNIPVYKISPNFLMQSIGLVPIFPQATTTLASVAAGSPAALGGLLAEDTILSIDGVAIESWQALVDTVSAAPKRSLNIRYQRDQVVQQVAIAPQRLEREGKAFGRLGVSPQILPYAENQRVAVHRSLWQSLVYGVEQTWLMSSVTLRMIWRMLTLQASYENISGPITIAEVTGKAMQVGLDYYLNILAVISISLGVINLLPIPMLDGGHLLMYAVEVVAGQSASEKVFAVGQRIGLVLLLCLMSLAFYNDIFRLLN